MSTMTVFIVKVFLVSISLSLALSTATKENYTRCDHPEDKTPCEDYTDVENYIDINSTQSNDILENFITDEPNKIASDTFSKLSEHDQYTQSSSPNSFKDEFTTEENFSKSLERKKLVSKLIDTYPTVLYILTKNFENVSTEEPFPTSTESIDYFELSGKESLASSTPSYTNKYSDDIFPELTSQSYLFDDSVAQETSPYALEAVPFQIPSTNSSLFHFQYTPPIEIQVNNNSTNKYQLTDQNEDDNSNSILQFDHILNENRKFGSKDNFFKNKQLFIEQNETLKLLNFPTTTESSFNDLEDITDRNTNFSYNSLQQPLWIHNQEVLYHYISTTEYPQKSFSNHINNITGGGGIHNQKTNTGNELTGLIDFTSTIETPPFLLHNQHKQDAINNSIRISLIDNILMSQQQLFDVKDSPVEDYDGFSTMDVPKQYLSGEPRGESLLQDFNSDHLDLYSEPLATEEVIRKHRENIDEYTNYGAKESAGENYLPRKIKILNDREVKTSSPSPQIIQSRNRSIYSSNNTQNFYRSKFRKMPGYSEVYSKSSNYEELPHNNAKIRKHDFMNSTLKSDKQLDTKNLTSMSYSGGRTRNNRQKLPVGNWEFGLKNDVAYIASTLTPDKTFDWKPPAVFKKRPAESFYRKRTKSRGTPQPLTETLKYDVPTMIPLTTDVLTKNIHPRFPSELSTQYSNSPTEPPITERFVTNKYFGVSIEPVSEYTYHQTEPPNNQRYTQNRFQRIPKDSIRIDPNLPTVPTSNERFIRNKYLRYPTQPSIENDGSLKIPPPNERRNRNKSQRVTTEILTDNQDIQQTLPPPKETKNKIKYVASPIQPYTENPGFQTKHSTNTYSGNKLSRAPNETYIKISTVQTIPQYQQEPPETKPFRAGRPLGTFFSETKPIESPANFDNIHLIPRGSQKFVPSPKFIHETYGSAAELQPTSPLSVQNMHQRWHPEIRYIEQFQENNFNDHLFRQENVNQQSFVEVPRLLRQGYQHGRQILRPSNYEDHDQDRFKQYQNTQQFYKKNSHNLLYQHHEEVEPDHRRLYLHEDNQDFKSIGPISQQPRVPLAGQDFNKLVLINYRSGVASSYSQPFNAFHNDDILFEKPVY